MKNHEAKNRVNREGECWEAEHIRTVPIEVVRQSFKVNPTEDKWKRYGQRNYAAPHDQHVRRPT